MDKMLSATSASRLRRKWLYYRWPVFLASVIISIFIISLYIIRQKDAASATSRYARTSRELGPPPDYNREMIELWLLFFTNVRRADQNLHPLVFSRPLREAARWQAAYSAKLGFLNHFSEEPRMETAGKRIKFFSGNIPRYWGENLVVVFQTNQAGVNFRWKSDEKGKYKDYGSSRIRWLSEQEIAHSMIVSVMNSETHRINALNTSFFFMGPGVVNHPFKDEAAFWGGQVFSDGPPAEALTIRNFAFQKRKTETGMTELRLKLFNKPDLRPSVFRYGNGRITELLGYPEDDYMVFLVPQDDDADVIYRFGAKDPVNRIYYPIRRVAWAADRYP